MVQSWRSTYIIDRRYGSSDRANLREPRLLDTENLLRPNGLNTNPWSERLCVNRIQLYLPSYGSEINVGKLVSFSFSQRLGSYRIKGYLG